MTGLEHPVGAGMLRSLQSKPPPRAEPVLTLPGQPARF